MLVTLHHLVVDGVSWRILVPDLASAVDGARRGAVGALEEPRTSFRDWATGLAEAAHSDRVTQSRPVWSRSCTDMAGGASEQTALGCRALDPARDTVSTSASVEVQVPGNITARILTSVPAAFRTGVADVLLAALAMAVTSVRGGSAVRVHLEGHGREEHIVPGADLSRTVGWFTSMYPVVLDLGTSLDDPALCLAHVKESLRAVPDNGIGFGILRRLSGGDDDLFTGYRAPEIVFNYLGRMTLGETASAPWSAAPEAAALGGSVDPATPLDHVLDVNAITDDGPDGPVLSAEFTYATGLLDATTAERIARAWGDALATLSRVADEPAAVSLTPSDLTATGLTVEETAELGRAVTGGLEDVVPLTPLQRGMYFLSGLDEDSVDVYTMQSVLDLDGAVDTVLLRRSISRLIERHAVLRTGFRISGSGVPIGVVAAAVETPFEVIDLSAEADPAGRADAFAESDRVDRFAADTAPLVRFRLLQLSGDRSRLVFTAHHLVLDGWSTPLLVQELFQIYAAGGDTSGLARAVPFTDYLAWLDRPSWRPFAGQWQKNQNAPLGAFWFSGGESGIVRLILGLTRRAARYGASLRLSKFVPDKFVEPSGFSPSHHHQKTKTPHLGRFGFLAERVGFEPTEGLTLRRFSRPVPSTARPSLHELFRLCKARCARHYAGFATGILPFAPSGPAAAPLSASASCLRVKTGASTARPSLRNSLLVAKRGCGVYQECCAGRPGLPFFDSASRHPKRIASGIIAPSSGSSSTGSRITIGRSWVTLA